MASSSAGSAQKSSDRRTSCGTVCSSNSSCFLQKRKPINPLARSIRTTVSQSNGNAVKQRVLSAKLLRLRTLQNQLNDANYHLVELAKENRALKTLQKRQDKALSRYEDTNADLPRLLKSHEEEIRALHERNKNMRRNIKDLTEQVKVKDEELINVKEQLKHLLTLTKDKHLGEREKLALQVEDLKSKLQSSENEINLLNRKLMLETKNTKYKLNQEIAKHKQCQKQLEQAFREIDRLTALIDDKGKFIGVGRKRFVNVPQRQAISMISLTGNVEEQTDKKQKEQEEHTNIKEQDEIITEKNIKSILKSPSECVKERLSASAHKEIEQKTDLTASILKSPTESIKERLSSANTYREIEQNCQPVDNKNFDNQSIKSIYSTASMKRSRPNSSQKLEKLKDNSSSNSNNTSSNSLDENIKQQLDDYRTEVVSSMMNCNKVVEQHRQDFEFAKSETEKLLDALRETDTIDAKLRHTDLLTNDLIKIPDEDCQLVNQILNDEYSFRKTGKKSANVLEDKYETVKSTDKNGNVTQRSSIAQEDKKKLLATLRAIDNGENIDTVTENSTRKTKLMKELFGSIDQ